MLWVCWPLPYERDTSAIRCSVPPRIAGKPSSAVVDHHDPEFSIVGRAAKGVHTLNGVGRPFQLRTITTVVAWVTARSEAATPSPRTARCRRSEESVA
jgi:hypothetical protein